jgi:hypothetical protein
MGGGRYRPRCKSCHRKRFPAERSGSQLRRQKKKRCKSGACDQCGFDPVHQCQLDLVHLNGDRKDFTPKNLTTLCANCGRLERFGRSRKAPCP